MYILLSSMHLKHTPTAMFDSWSVHVRYRFTTDPNALADYLCTVSVSQLNRPFNFDSVTSNRPLRQERRDIVGYSSFDRKSLFPLTGLLHVKLPALASIILVVGAARGPVGAQHRARVRVGPLLEQGAGRRGINPRFGRSLVR